MKFNVEVELNYIEGNAGVEFQRKLEEGVIEKVTEQISGEIMQKIADRADKLITAKTELLINTILEQPISVKKGWNDVTKYASTFDMVETRMSQLYGERMDVANGKCTKDPYLSKIEQYVDSHIKEMMRKVETAIKTHGKAIAQKSINEHELIQAIGATVKTVKQAGGRVEDKAVIK